MALENVQVQSGSGTTIFVVRDTVTHVVDHVHVDNTTTNLTRVQVYRFSNNAIVFDQNFSPGATDVSVPGGIVWDTNKNTLTATYGLRINNPA